MMKQVLSNTFRFAAAAVIAAPLAFGAAHVASGAEESVTAPRTEITTAPDFQVKAVPPGGESAPLTFSNPWLLAAGLLVPFILLMRTQQPPPTPMQTALLRFISRRKPEEETPEQTPFWQYCLRMGAAGLAVLAVAGPRMDPAQPLEGTGPLMMVVDNDWAAAAHWKDRVSTMKNLIDQAEREGRLVAVLPLAQPGDGTPVRTDGLVSPADARRIVSGLEPMAWPDDRAAALKAMESLDAGRDAAVVWLSNGLAANGETDEQTLPFVQRLTEFGRLTVFEDASQDAPLLLGIPHADGDKLILSVSRPHDDGDDKVAVNALAEDGTVLASEDVLFENGETSKEVTFELPAELRNRIQQFAIENEPSAGARILIDEQWRRRRVGLLADEASRPAQPLLDEFHYIDEALNPFVDLQQGDIDALLDSDLSLIVLGDARQLEPATVEKLEAWVEKGGTLLRFAGPHLADRGDSLVPVQLRRDGGARTLGGAMSFSEPAHIAPFEESSPFYGLDIPGDVTINQQVLAQPGSEADVEIWARLADSTPLVSAQQRGEGRVVLVHTTANADWSNLSLSGLFVDMLRKVVEKSHGVGGALDADQVLPPWQVLDGAGHLSDALPGVKGLTAEAIESGTISAAVPPGFYGDRDGGLTAHNLAQGIKSFEALAGLPSGTLTKTFEASRVSDLRGPLMAAMVILMLVDQLASMGQRGQLPGQQRSNVNSTGSAMRDRRRSVPAGP